MGHLKLFIAVLMLVLQVGLVSSAAAESGGHHNYHAALFLGATSLDNKTYGTVGADIEKRLSERFGVGLIVDALAESHGQTIIAAGLFYHPTEHLTFVLAPGTEFGHGTSQTVIRVGAGYGWHFQNGMQVGPVVNADFVNNHTAYVYGVSTGFGF